MSMKVPSTPAISPLDPRRGTLLVRTVMVSPLALVCGSSMRSFEHPPSMTSRSFSRYASAWSFQLIWKSSFPTTSFASAKPASRAKASLQPRKTRLRSFQKTAAGIAFSMPSMSCSDARRASSASFRSVMSWEITWTPETVLSAPRILVNVLRKAWFPDSSMMESS